MIKISLLGPNHDLFSSLRTAFIIIPPVNEVWGVYRNHPVCLSVCLSVQSKLNFDHNFLTKGDRALILQKGIPCDKTFLWIPKFLTS